VTRVQGGLNSEIHKFGLKKEGSKKKKEGEQERAKAICVRDVPSLMLGERRSGHNKSLVRQKNNIRKEVSRKLRGKGLAEKKRFCLVEKERGFGPLLGSWRSAVFGLLRSKIAMRELDLKKKRGILPKKKV